MRVPKMTLDDLRALRPVWAQGERTEIAEAVRRFCAAGVHGVKPADLPTADLMKLLGGAALARPPAPPEAQAFADAVCREYAARIARSQSSAPAALAWLGRNERVGATYLVAHLRCPKGKLLAGMYCLPKDIAPVHDSDGFRLLIVPSARGQLAAIAGNPRSTRPAGSAWWYISDDDVWELRCKCCPHPDGGVQARDFLAGETRTRPGYTAVLL
ncbi:MAG: hypothetical protein ACRDTV_09235 [Mycobacterium sp.]